MVALNTEGLYPPQTGVAPERRLLSVLSREQVNEQERAIREASQPTPVTLALSAHIDRCFESAKMEKTSSGVDERLLKAMRQRKGEYEPVMLDAIRKTGGSEIFMKLTEVKCAGAEAWIGDMYRSPDGRAVPFSIEATPLPDLPEYMVQGVIQETMQAVQQDIQLGRIMPSEQSIFEFANLKREYYLARLREAAKTAADAMQVKIDDQLTECKFMDVFAEWLKDLVTFGTAIMKGPILRKARKLRYSNGIPYAYDAPVLEFDRVSPFDAYPAPGALTPGDGYFCQRLRHSRRQIEGLKGLAGVNDAMVDLVLMDYGRTGYSKIEYPDTERRRLGDQTMMTNNDDVIEGVEYNGCVQGKMLLEFGLTGLEPFKEYEVVATKYGAHVVRAMLNPDPLYRRKFHKAVYEPIIDSFWGFGVPDLMEDIQRAVNAAARSLIDNMGMSSRPMAYIDDITRLPGGADDVEAIFPGQIWQFVNPGGQSRNEPMKWFLIANNSEQLMHIMDEFEKKADVRTRIPAFAYGSDADAVETYSTMSLLTQNAMRSIKKIIAGIDRDMLRPAVEGVYFFNMLYDPDQSIKGDVNVVARGALGLMLHEQQLMEVSAFLKDTAVGPDAQIVDLPRRANLLRKRAEKIGGPVTDYVPSKDEMKQRIMAIASAPPQAPDGAGKSQVGK